MMVGAVAIFCRTEHAAILNHASLSGFSPPNTHGKSSYLTCKTASDIPANRNYTLHFQNPGGKLASRTIAHSLPHENEDAERQISCHFPDDPVFIYSDNDRNSKELSKESAASLVQSGTDFQPFVFEQRDPENLLDKLNAVQLHILAMEQWNASRLKACHKTYSANAANLMHYLALKSLNMEQIKDELSSVGLLNLETMNPYVLSSLSACIQMLISSTSKSSLTIGDSDKGHPIRKNLGYQTQDLAKDAMIKRASSNCDLLLGKLQGSRMSHIMVTIGQEAVENDTHIPELIKAGTSIFRINCAHGNTDIWSEIITRVKKSSQLLEKPCRVLMDLAGPKLRTGKLKAGPCVVKISPKRDVLGNLIRPAHVWLSPHGAGPPPPHVSPDVILYVDGQDFLSQLKADDIVRCSDVRGNRRSLRILSKYSVFSGAGFMAECSKTAYVESGTTLYFKEKHRKSCVGFVVDIPPAEQFVRLRVGDLLMISRDTLDEQNSSSSSSVGTHRITCPSGYLFDSVKPGDPIAFDDGKIWGVIKGTSMSEVVVSITHAGLKGTKLGSEKSINIPESDIKYEGLTSKDIMDLDFVAAHADMVGISFVRDVCDIVVLHQELAKRKLSTLGIVLKIETKGGFEKLPLLILEAMKSSNPLGVMIARGDLAVECGWEKLADIQEEIFSICSAAHVPVILATQVLESLIRSGVPTRAEITDAANGRRASCVMLNKGKNVLKAVSTLDTILNKQHTDAKAELKPLLLSSHVN